MGGIVSIFGALPCSRGYCAEGIRSACIAEDREVGLNRRRRTPEGQKDQRGAKRDRKSAARISRIPRQESGLAL